jgi:HEPN domain-containing protein
MTTETSNWWKKAESDYRTMRREVAAEPPNYDAACFHAQQCIEKLLKASMYLNSQDLGISELFE